MKQPPSSLVSRDRGGLKAGEASKVTMEPNSEDGDNGEPLWEGVHIGWSQQQESVHLQAKQSISELVMNT